MDNKPTKREEETVARQSPKDENLFIEEIKQIVRQGRNLAYSAVNATMITTYWHIGKRIVEEEQHGKERAEYGKELIDLLAKELTHEYGAGFSARYLRAFRQFYLVIPDYEIWKSRFPNLSWTHIFRTLRVGDETAIKWYLETASREMWSVNRKAKRNISNATRNSQFTTSNSQFLTHNS